MAESCGARAVDRLDRGASARSWLVEPIRMVRGVWARAASVLRGVGSQSRSARLGARGVGSRGSVDSGGWLVDWPR
jgi:hypothetical protein